MTERTPSTPTVCPSCGMAYFGLHDCTAMTRTWTERTPSTGVGRTLVRLDEQAPLSHQELLDGILAIEDEAESSLRVRLAAEVRDLGPNDCGEPASTNEPRTFASGTGVGMAMMKSAVLQVIEGASDD